MEIDFRVPKLLGLIKSSRDQVMERETIPELREALAREGLLEVFEEFPEDDRKFFVRWVEGASDERHRQVRITMLLDAMTSRSDDRAT